MSRLDPLHMAIAGAWAVGADWVLMDKLLALCDDGECAVCGSILCPWNEPLHFHHDGCPACAADPDAEFTTPTSELL